MKKLELNFAAIDFAKAILTEPSALKIDSLALDRARELDLSDEEYRLFNQQTMKHRNDFLALQRQDEKAAVDALAAEKRKAIAKK